MLILHNEIITALRRAMAGTQRFRNADDCRRHFIGAGNLHIDCANHIRPAKTIAAQQTRLCRGERHQHLVILISEAAAALACQHTNHAVRLAVHPHRLAHRPARTAKQCVCNGAPQHHHRRVRDHICVRDKFAIRHNHVAHNQIVRRDAHCARIHVMAQVGQLRPAGYFRRNSRHRRKAGQRRRIFLR